MVSKKSDVSTRKRPGKREEEAANPRKLTEKERRFVEAYMGEAAGNGTKAAEIAGYKARSKTALAQQAHYTLKKPKVRQELEERVKSDPLVASRQEIQHWLTKIVRGEDVLDALAKDRIKSAELILKTRGELLDRREEKTESTVRYVVTTEDQLTEDERALMGETDGEEDEES